MVYYALYPSSQGREGRCHSHRHQRSHQRLQQRRIAEKRHPQPYAAQVKPGPEQPQREDHQAAIEQPVEGCQVVLDDDVGVAEGDQYQERESNLIGQPSSGAPHHLRQEGEEEQGGEAGRRPKGQPAQPAAQAGRAGGKVGVDQPQRDGQQRQPQVGPDCRLQDDVPTALLQR